MTWQCALTAPEASVSWVHHKERDEQGEGGDSPRLLLSPETPPAVLRPPLGTTAQEDAERRQAVQKRPRRCCEACCTFALETASESRACLA